MVRMDDSIPNISGFGSGVIQDLKKKTVNNITAFVGNEDEAKILEDDIKYDIDQRDTIEIINSIVNDEDSGDSDIHEKKRDNIDTDKSSTDDKE
eukprot:CAMPEP_0201590496 /NCGR_PEP_ID=MMETSP0190_2-20130828/178381_1 /ASSEMBLY_ACC=CAM_ASM_000263 /TAXON_ID=37353 /ORGANISM="Rosalina sp." /LENGTH=93 /DNA_ID=CAMNT_0048046771 /DNA_START=9 /DNA_END=287 /DNA_ORIENTATION=-